MLMRFTHFRVRTPLHIIILKWFKFTKQFSQRTQQHYQMVLSNFEKQSPQYLEQLSLEHLEQYLFKLRNKGNCNRTLNAHLTALKSFCRWLGEHDLADIPISKIKMFKEDPPKVRILSTEEYQRLLSVANPLQADVIKFLAHTGLRLSEWRSLSWHNVSADMQYLSIIGKGRKRRIIPLSQTARQIVIRFSKSFPYKAKSNLYRMLNILAKKAGIEKLGPHSLRHFFATNLYKRGVPLQLLSKILGHSDSRTTEIIYCHIWPEKDLIGITDILDL